MDELELYINILDEEKIRKVAAELIKNTKFRLRGGFSAASCPLPILKKTITESLKKNFKTFSQLLKNLYIDDTRYKNVFSSLSAENFMRIMYLNNEASDKALGLFLAFYPGRLAEYPWVKENIAAGKQPFEFEWGNENIDISTKELILLLTLQKDYDLLKGQLYIYIEKLGKRIILKYNALILEIKALSWQEIIAKLRVYRQACASELDFFMVLILSKIEITNSKMIEEDLRIFQSIVLLISGKYYEVNQKKRLRSLDRIKKYRKNSRNKQKNMERKIISIEEKNEKLVETLDLDNKKNQDNILEIEHLRLENAQKTQEIINYKTEAEKNQAIITGSRLYIAPELQNMINESSKERAIILLSEENSPLFQWFFQDVIFMKNNERANKLIASLSNEGISEPIFINTLGITQSNLLKITNKLKKKHNDIFLIFANTPVECITEILKRL